MEELDIRAEDLSENNREYARVIGIEALLKLCKEFGGTPIKKEYLETDISMGAIARKYGVSESTVYRLVRDESGRKNIPGQLNMFD